MLRKRGFWRFWLDLILIIYTGGIYFIWIVMRNILRKEFHIWLTKEK